MSTPAKLTLGCAMAISLGTISYVHFKQQSDRSKLHEGVLRDVERQQRRKMENIIVLQQQIDLARKLRNDLELTNEKPQQS